MSIHKGTTYRVIDTTSMANSITGTATDVGLLHNWVCHFVWTGTPTGSVEVQASIDNTSWTTLTGSQQSTQGEAGTHIVNFSGSGHRYIRPVYTRSSGSGTLDVYLTGN
jgi:hypothetical protein